jgi:hypothetical protein
VARRRRRCQRFSLFWVTPQTFESGAPRTFVLSARSPVFRSNPMQLWESELVYVAKCLHCHGRPRMHRHGAFKRTGSDGLPTMLQRYRCPRCLRTCSILKDGMLPYRRISAEELQNCLDNPQQSQAKTEPHKLPEPVLSAAKRFHGRTSWLVTLMGPGLFCDCPSTLLLVSSVSASGRHYAGTTAMQQRSCEF